MRDELGGWRMSYNESLKQDHSFIKKYAQQIQYIQRIMLSTTDRYNDYNMTMTLTWLQKVQKHKLLLAEILKQ